MVRENLKLENATIGRGGFRNFSGEKTRYNRDGKRTFTVILEEELGHRLEEEGWHIRYREPQAEGEPTIALLTVEVRFGEYPPKVIMIVGEDKTPLDETNIDILDTAEIVRADMVIRPYNWTVDDNSGTKAYLKTLYVTVEDDDFGGRYS